MAFKLKHKGAATLMQSLSAMPQPVRKMPVQKAPVKKDPDPGNKNKSTKTKASNGLFDDMEAVDKYNASKAYKAANEQERARMQREFVKRKLKDYEKTAGDEGYNKMMELSRQKKAEYTKKYGDPSDKGIDAEERLARTEAIRANTAADLGRADYRTNRNATDSKEYKAAMSKYRAESDRLKKIYDLEMQGREWSKYKKQPTATAGAKKVKGMGPVKKYKK